MTPGSEKPVEEQRPLNTVQDASPGSEASGGEGAGPALAGPQTEPEKPGKSSLREWVETLVVALLVALVIRAFVVQVYLVEGPSMEPTLHTAERLFVNKFVYRVRDPRPGEIVVLQDPGRPQRELIKRVIAVEGETVEIRKGIVYINGKPLKEAFTNTVVTRREDISPTVVPPGTIYVMGDNRSMSFDSRALGAIAVDKVDGKAFFMFWPIDRFGYGPLDQPRQYDDSAAAIK
ncbi:MAG TPA: signal peptidase I [Symbiobacteriaceae bacterium]|nr:signal peptidase I [Symbiobacteriaceae bacterium]